MEMGLINNKRYYIKLPINNYEKSLKITLILKVK